MPRIRTIKPEFWQDEKLVRLDPMTRLVFLGLVSMADDAGRLVDNVKLIDGFLFSETEDSARDALVTLANLSRVIRYTSASGQKLIQIANWKRHQKVDHPSPYNLPAPTAEDLEASEDAANSRNIRENGARDSRDSRASINDQRSTTNDLRPSTDDQKTADSNESDAGAVRKKLYTDRAALMGVVREVCYAPDGKPREPRGDATDADILTGWLRKGRSPEEIERAIRGVRLAIDAGEIDFAPQKQKFGLKILNHTHSGARHVWEIALDAYGRDGVRESAKRGRSGFASVAELLPRRAS
jgi:hypothetical protein